MLYGCILLDGESYELYDYFDRTGDTLDEAGGDYIRLLAVGDPERSGPIHKSLRTEQQQKRDTEDARTYLQEFYLTGRDVSYRRDQVKIVRERLGLAASDLPCIAFVRRPDPPVLGILRIAPSWYESPSSMKVFGKNLRSWLSRADVKRLATEDLGDRQLASRLHSSLAALTTEIESAIGPSLPGSTPPNRAKGMVHFNTPAGATWQDVEIKFVDGHTISVNVLGERGRFSYTQMGMADGRNVSPTQQWKLLETFAYHRGRLTWGDSEATRKNQKRRERLAGDLRAFFRIEGDPFCLTDDQKGWRTRFSISLD
jgi:hypothetical protein